MRIKLPNTRKGYTTKFNVNGHKFFLRTGEYDDGKLGEIFIDYPKEESTLRGFLHCLAISISIGLQYGVPLSEYSKSMKDFSFPPNGDVVGSDTITTCQSMVDCIIQELENNYANI